MSASRPGCSLPPGETRYPLYMRLGGPQGRSGQVRKISPPPGFDPRTVQPIDSRYTDYATRPTIGLKSVIILCYQTVAVSTLNGIIEVDVRNCGSKFKDLRVFIFVSVYKLLP